jgi:hypothetical protein
LWKLERKKNASTFNNNANILYLLVNNIEDNNTLGFENKDRNNKYLQQIETINIQYAHALSLEYNVITIILSNPEQLPFEH